jgi:nucleotide-binding universal stress UspA family protein
VDAGDAEEGTVHTTPLPLLVGVTGRGENTAALRFAVDESARVGGEVRLLLAVHELLPPPPPSVLLSSPVDWERAAKQVLREVEEELTDLAGEEVPLRLLAREGRPAHALVEESRSVRMVVLQHRKLSTLHRIFTGSTVGGVASRAGCPVASVPPGWTPPSSPGWVTVGIHEDGAPQAVLEEAFNQAAARGSSLRVVHAWMRDGIYDQFILADTDDETSRELERELHASVDHLRDGYPDVAVEVSVLHRWPPDALVGLSATSDLLVVGRHGRHPPLPHTLGSMARTILNAAECPVIVVPL